MMNWKKELINWLRNQKLRLLQWARVLKQIIYGMTVYDMVRELNKERGTLERVFILSIYSDILGIPLFTPYYSLRLLPYVMPKFDSWKMSLLRERDITDLCEQEIT
jgi:hypothetical protein